MAVGDVSTPSGENAPAATQTEQAESNAAQAQVADTAQAAQASGAAATGVGQGAGSPAAPAGLSGSQAAPAPSFGEEPGQARPETGNLPVSGGDDEQFLFGKTGRPLEPIFVPGATSGKIDLSASARAALPDLIRASQDPDAPPALRGLVKLLLFHQEKQLGR